MISIIVTCYNQQEFIDDCLNSVACQIFKNWECIIIDDGSTDNSAKIAQNWVEKDNRFRYFFQQNAGTSTARNAGIDKAKGSYIQFLDGDDTIDPTKIEKSYHIIQNEQTDVVITNFYEIRNNKKHPPFCDLTKYPFNYKNLLLQWDIDFNIPIHCFLFTKKIIEGLYFPVQFLLKEDWIMWLGVFKRNPKVSFINQQLVAYRIHHKNITSNKMLVLEQEKKAWAYILKNEKLYFEDFFFRIISLYEKKILKITKKTWYKKILHAIVNK